MNGLTAIILAAGESSRMSFPKALLPFNHEEVFFIKLINAFVKIGCEKVVLVHNQKDTHLLKKHYHTQDQKKFILVVNSNPFSSRLFSLKLGLNALTTNDYCFIHNVDNPWANESVLKQLFNHRFDNPVIKAVFDGRGGHPILINSLVMNYIKSYEDDSITLKKLLNQFSCTSVMVDDPNILININCPEDYNRYFPDMPFPLDI